MAPGSVKCTLCLQKSCHQRICHTCEGRYPSSQPEWIPAYAGMTSKNCEHCGAAKLADSPLFSIFRKHCSGRVTGQAISQPRITPQFLSSRGLPRDPYGSPLAAAAHRTPLWCHPGRSKPALSIVEWKESLQISTNIRAPCHDLFTKSLGFTRVNQPLAYRQRPQDLQ